MEGYVSSGSSRHWILGVGGSGVRQGSLFFHCQENGKHLSNSKNIWLILPQGLAAPALLYSCSSGLVHTLLRRPRARQLTVITASSARATTLLFAVKHTLFSSVDANPQVTLYVLFHAFHFSIQISFYSRSARLPHSFNVDTRRTITG